MSDITLCLITKGRPEFLNELLASFDRALDLKNVKILVILNGVDANIMNDFYKWGEKHIGRVDFVSFAQNDAGISRLWSEITSLKTKWVMFPSDDDVINNGLAGVLDNLESIPAEIGAVATPLNLIDSKGLEIGLARKPIFSPDLSTVENSAKAISQCPFLWPGLIIKVSVLPQHIPNTRYVTDWWIGLYLIFSTGIAILDSPVIFYRVHEQQESFAASLSRKNLEGLTHLGGFFQSPTFSDWLNARTPAEVMDFLLFIRKYPPLYGEIKFSSELVSIITKRVMDLRIENDVHRVALFTNAFAHDVLIDTAQLKYFGDSEASRIIDANVYNYNFTMNTSVCQTVKVLGDSCRDSKNTTPSLRVGCNHTVRVKGEIQLNCDEKYSQQDLIDQLIIKCAEHFQSQEIFQNSVSPFEYRLVKSFRLIKNHAPKILLKSLQKIKGSE
jgi:hypothetical protein